MVCAPALAAESDKPDVSIFQKTEPDLRPASSSRPQLRNTYLQRPVSSSSFAPRGSSKAFSLRQVLPPGTRAGLLTSPLPPSASSRLLELSNQHIYVFLETTFPSKIVLTSAVCQPQAISWENVWQAIINISTLLILQRNVHFRVKKARSED